MGFDFRTIFENPPSYLYALLAVAGLAVAAMLWRLARRHRDGAERVTVRLSDPQR